MRRTVLIQEACFQQACEETRLLLADTALHSREYVFVSGFHESLLRRGNSLMRRKGEPVNFYAILRKTLPDHFPDFEFDPKWLRFTRLLVPHISFWFSYTKDRSSLGKMFSIDLGLSLDEGIEFTISIFRFFGAEMDRPTWVYHTQEELKLCIAESLQMLSKVLPAFQQSLSAYMTLDAREAGTIQ